MACLSPKEDELTCTMIKTFFSRLARTFRKLNGPSARACLPHPSFSNRPWPTLIQTIRPYAHTYIQKNYKIQGTIFMKVTKTQSSNENRTKKKKKRTLNFPQPNHTKPSLPANLLSLTQWKKVPYPKPRKAFEPNKREREGKWERKFRVQLNSPTHTHPPFLLS